MQMIFIPLISFYKKSHCTEVNPLNPIKIGLFGAAHRDGEGGRAKSPPLPKICHTYPIIMKLGTLTPYLKKIQKIYKSSNTPFEFCPHQYFFTGNQQNCAVSKNTGIDCILIKYFEFF